MLALEARRWPTGDVYGDVPIQWSVTPSGERSAGFPQQREFDVLTGRLSSGAHVALLNGGVSYLMPNQGRARGSAAMLSLEPFGETDPRLYSRVEFQVEGIEALVGARPIKSASFPAPSADVKTWSATIDDGLPRKWESDGVSMTYGFNGRFRVGRGYEFQLAFGPVITIEVDQPLSAIEWYRCWVYPMREMVSVLTRAPRLVTFVLLADATMNTKDQLFGWDITQDPRNSVDRAVNDANPAIVCDRDNVSLLSLALEWDELAANEHPIIETYGRMATQGDQHPRSRVLNLIQALEGSFGHERQAELEERQARHDVRRSEFLDRMKRLLPADDVKYLKRTLMKRAPSGLAQVLSATFDAPPVDVRDEVLGCQAVQARMEANGGGRVEDALANIRNDLSHGSRGYDAHDLDELAKILDRVVRAEVVRLLGAPEEAVVRALTPT
ncbi:hypothetical protein [Xylanimonas protaetiae]|nr:hypothetical protein [Xylanimonas protaetiae]